MRLLKILVVTVLLGLVALVGAWLGLAQYFSRSQPAVTRAEAQASLNAAIGWLKTHEEDVLNDGNQALWRMVHKSAQLTHDAYLARLYDTYYERHYGRGHVDMWDHWLRADSTAPVTLDALNNLAPYQLFFLYASTCNGALLEDDAIARQHSPQYCAPALPRALHEDATCSTHQLMAMLMMQERQCGNALSTQNTIEVLQSDIVTQLRYDPWLRDVYIQRVLMLYEAGAGPAVRPAWLHRVIKSQQPDGGWIGYRPHQMLLGDLVSALGLRNTWLSTEVRAPDFHATAQGLLLMSLVLTESSSASTR